MSTIGTQIKIEKQADVLTIEIFAKQDKTKNNLLMLWLFLWSVAGLIVLTQYFTVQDDSVKTVLIVWLGFWLYFEYKTIKAYTWRRNGKEVLSITKEQLVYKRAIRNKGKEEIFDCKSIKNFKLIDADDAGFWDVINNSYWTISGETISFNYGELTKKIGLQVDTKDAKELVTILKRTCTSQK
jgi:hypothetical protein